jgi:tetratricopeptide (TPR) repeat protein
VEQFHRLPDAHDFLAELASAAAEAGELSVAKDSWNRARQHAALIGDVAGAAKACAGLAEILEQEGDFTHADQALVEALTHEHTPEDEALLLKQRLGLLLKSDNPQKAGKVYARLRALTEEHGLREEAIDAHMLIGDHEWATRKSYAEAVKAYTAALAKSFELGLGIMVRVGSHIVQKLLLLASVQRIEQINRIQRSVETWLRHQVESEKDFGSAGVLLWPLRLASRVTIATAEGRSLSDKQIADFLREELFENARK